MLCCAVLCCVCDVSCTTKNQHLKRDHTANSIARRSHSSFDQKSNTKEGNTTCIYICETTLWYLSMYEYYRSNTAVVTTTRNASVVWTSFDRSVDWLLCVCVYVYCVCNAKQCARFKKTTTTMLHASKNTHTHSHNHALNLIYWFPFCMLLLLLLFSVSIHYIDINKIQIEVSNFAKKK